jgi:NADH:ubiquinone oxidoreductase subunit
MPCAGWTPQALPVHNSAAMNLGTRLYTWWAGNLVGTDQFGNTYYREKNFRVREKGAGRFSRERRWVIFSGAPEATKVPPEWHGWLHHTFKDPPPPAHERKRYPWQKEHQQNLTGTPLAYRPRGSVLRRGPRARATGDYEAWTPE